MRVTDSGCQAGDFLSQKRRWQLNDGVTSKPAFLLPHKKLYHSIQFNEVNLQAACIWLDTVSLWLNVTLCVSPPVLTGCRRGWHMARDSEYKGCHCQAWSHWTHGHWCNNAACSNTGHHLCLTSSWTDDDLVTGAACRPRLIGANSRQQLFRVLIPLCCIMRHTG